MEQASYVSASCDTGPCSWSFIPAAPSCVFGGIPNHSYAHSVSSNISRCDNLPICVLLIVIAVVFVWFRWCLVAVKIILQQTCFCSASFPTLQYSIVFSCIFEQVQQNAPNLDHKFGCSAHSMYGQTRVFFRACS